MPEKDHIGEVWAHNRLQRMIKEGERVYERCVNRKIEWPELSPSSSTSSTEAVTDRIRNTNLDEAFSSVLQFMSETSKQCKRYYSTNPTEPHSQADRLHCCRFHTPYYRRVHRRTQVNSSEDVHILVPPGSYSVTSHKDGQSQTHVVNTKPRQTVNMKFSRF